jgi:hypothetical protein
VEAIIHRDIQQRFWFAVIFVGQFPRLKFERLISGEERNSRHCFRL